MSRHQHVIVGGLGSIALVLGVLMVVDKSRIPTASVGQVIAEVSVTLSPDMGTGGSRSAGKKKIGDTAVTPSMSPIVSPIIGDTSPMTPTVSPILIASPIVSPKQVSPSPSPKTPTPSPVVSSTVTPSRTPLSPTPTPTPASFASPSSIPSPSVTPSALQSVIFSEIGWMGTGASSTDEWIELYNPNATPISLEGWVVKSETDGSPTVTLTGTIAARGTYVLERTNDEPLEEIAAHWKGSFGSGGLKNEGEQLVLLDAQGALQDSVGPGPWYAGDSVTKASMERINPGILGNSPQNWRTATQVSSVHDAAGGSIIGTPGQF